MNPDSRRVWIWRKKRIITLFFLVREISSFRDHGLMVIRVIMRLDRTKLYTFEAGSVIARRYVDEVLQHYVRLFRGVVGPKPLLMDDNDRYI